MFLGNSRGVFDLIDGNADGSISIREWCDAAIQQEHLRTLFDLDAPDNEAFFGEIRTLFKNIGCYRSSTISFKEFSGYFDEVRLIAQLSLIASGIDAEKPYHFE